MLIYHHYQKLKLIGSRANHIYDANIPHITYIIDEGGKTGETNNKREGLGSVPASQFMLIYWFWALLKHWSNISCWLLSCPSWTPLLCWIGGFVSCSENSWSHCLSNSRYIKVAKSHPQRGKNFVVGLGLPSPLSYYNYFERWGRWIMWPWL